MTGVIELKPARDDDNHTADDDPKSVQLMVDYFYLGDYFPGLITGTKSRAAADAIGMDISSEGEAQEEGMKYDWTTESRLEQRDEARPEPGPSDGDPSMVQAEEEEEGKGKQINRERSPLSED